MKELKPEELKVGMFVTVIRGQSLACGLEDNSYKKDVLEIKAINAPKIVFHNHTAWQVSRRQILETGEWGFGALSKDFVKAALDKCGCGKD